MPDSAEPHVVIAVPVYNGARFLDRCISSVLCQDYQNWRLVICDNRSTDATPAIARRYCEQDRRITLQTYDEHVDVIESHNRAARFVPDDALYWKFLQSDDELLPGFLRQMTGCGEAHPSAGLIGSYMLWGARVAADGLALDERLIEGKTLCRRVLLGDVYPFVNLSGLLFASRHAPANQFVLNGPKLHADVDAYFGILGHSDFAFCHQVMSHIRVHDASMSALQGDRLFTYPYANLDMLARHGHEFLSDEAFTARWQTHQRRYMTFLARRLFSKQDEDFWPFHRDRFRELGLTLQRRRLWLCAVLMKLGALVDRGLALATR